MTGAFLIGFLVLGIIFLIVAIVTDDYSDGWRISSTISFILFLLWLIAIPVSRMHSKANAEYIKGLQVTIDYNRQNDQNLNVLERTAIIEEINSCNMKITTWRVTGKKWYNNKWYYHPSTQSVEFIK